MNSSGTNAPIVVQTAMITGQVYDTIGGFGSEISESDRLALIHRNKTGALLRGACRLGAICGKADSEQLGALTDFGETIGLMFQIVDDLLDVTQKFMDLLEAAVRRHPEQYFWMHRTWRQPPHPSTLSKVNREFLAGRPPDPTPESPPSNPALESAAEQTPGSEPEPGNGGR